VNGNKLGPWASKYLLWLAYWTYDLHKQPTVPAAWKDAGKTWTFWQWNGEQLAYRDIICPDCFHGNPEQLLKMFPVEEQEPEPSPDKEDLRKLKGLLEKALSIVNRLLGE